MTLDELADEMIEFGVSRDTVLRMAPALLPYFNDPDGRFAIALADAAPVLANKLGLANIQIH